MAPVSTAHRDVPGEGLSLGVCVPAKFPEAELRIALKRGGHTPVFWHDAPGTAIEAFKDCELDVFLLGAPRLDRQALECISAVLRESPSTSTVLICERLGERDIRKAIDAGARALVLLNEIGEALVPVIGSVRAGQVSVPGSAGREASRTILTQREKQILGQVVLGMTNADIANNLFLAESTVKSHLSSAFSKLGVRSRNEAAAMILDPASGIGTGILTIPAERVQAPS